ncbi:MAG: hypothetical protein AAGF84_05685 [Planctomycetota bacterium]
MRPCTRLLLATAVTGLTTPAWAVTAPFTETYDGGVYTVGTPSFEGGGSTTITATLENDALTTSASSTARNSLVLEVPDAAPTPGLSVTQSVDFTITDGFFGSSRLGFVFAANQPEAAGEGPSDAIYTYIKEPSGDFEPTFLFVNALTEADGQVSISNNSDAENRGIPSIAEDITYTYTSTVSFLENGDELIDMTLIDTATGGTNYSQTYSFTMPDDLPDTPEIEDEPEVAGTYYGLYFRNFNPEEADTTVVFDNWSLSTVLVANGLTGDFDDSGSVEQGDLNLVLTNWGADRTFEDPGGTAFASDTVDQEELNLVLTNWGSSSAPSFEGFAVPEPASISILIGFGAMSLRRRGA